MPYYQKGDVRLGQLGGGARRVYLQAVLDDGRALLLAQTAGVWQVEAFYD